MNDLRIGVIGTGGRGRIAHHAHRPGAGSRIVACCDIDPAVLEQARKDYGDDVFTTDDYRRLLEQPLDGVVVCSPDDLHESQGLAVLDKGLGLYLEKPMAITTVGCDALLRKARERKARLFVGHNMRYMAVIRKMRALVEEGRVGKVKAVWCRHFISYGGDAYFRDWHADRRRSTGLLLQKGAHDLDVIHWLAGGYTRRVSAFGNLAVYGDLPRRASGERGSARFNETHWPPRAQTGFNPVMDIEDQNIVNMELDNGILATYMQCHFAPDCCRNYTVIGDEGRLENLGDRPDSPIMLWNRRKDTYRVIGDEVHYGEQPVDTEGHGGADPLIMAAFLKHLREGGDLFPAPEAARMAVAVGCAATESLRNGGQPLDIPPLP